MAAVLPSWIDEVQGVDFSPEKELLGDLEQWALNRGWDVSDGSSLSSELRQRTDVLISRPAKEEHLRVAVLPKTKKGPGSIRVDAIRYEPFNHIVFELMYEPKSKRWRVETGTFVIADDIHEDGKGWDWLVSRAFRG
jgi:hypothetical protein